MSNYRRLISYIYAYEGGVKGRNIGFAKIETRNGQCRINVNVKKVYVGGSDMGVYLLSGKQEIFLGNIFIRNGAGEFRGSVSFSNVENTGITMDECYGLTVHEVDSAWQAYTTIWEDAVAQAAEVELAGASAQAQTMHAEEISELEKKVTQEIEEEINIPKEPIHNSVQEETKAKPDQEIQEAVMRGKASEPAGHQPQTEWMPQERPQAEGQAQEQPETGGQVEMNPQPDLQSQPAGPVESQFQPGNSMEFQSGFGSSMEPQPETAGSMPPQTQRETMAESQPEAGREMQSQPEQTANLGDTTVLERLEQEEEAQGGYGRTWDYLSRNYPKIPAFDYVHGCEILTIKPQDIGLLPRENWVYGNNSFLLHGYYNYRYLILVKLNNPEGTPRYLMGVPGHYYSNEKYMASMFGFPNFVLSKKQPMEDGRFGYWYTDIKLGNQ